MLTSWRRRDTLADFVSFAGLAAHRRLAADTRNAAVAARLLKQPMLPDPQVINRRVRAILLTRRGRLLLIKRVKPMNGTPYWVAPGGGVEAHDLDLVAALRRELWEELGAKATVLADAFVLEHEKAGKALEESFFVCRLDDYDISLRAGPEFDDPTRGEYIPDEIALRPSALKRINFQTPELRVWLLRNLTWLRAIA